MLDAEEVEEVELPGQLDEVNSALVACVGVTLTANILIKERPIRLVIEW